MGFSLRRSARLAATLGTGVLTVWIIAALSLRVTDFKNSDAAVPLQDGREAPLSVESESLYAPHVVVDADTGPSVAANKVTETWDELESAATALPLRHKRQGPLLNASRTLKTRLRAHGGSGQHRPAAASSIHTIPRLGVMASAVSLSALVSCE